MRMMNDRNWWRQRNRHRALADHADTRFAFDEGTTAIQYSFIMVICRCCWFYDFFSCLKHLWNREIVPNRSKTVIAKYNSSPAHFVNSVLWLKCCVGTQCVRIKHLPNHPSFNTWHISTGTITRQKKKWNQKKTTTTRGSHEATNETATRSIAHRWLKKNKSNCHLYEQCQHEIVLCMRRCSVLCPLFIRNKRRFRRNHENAPREDH